MGDLRRLSEKAVAVTREVVTPVHLFVWTGTTFVVSLAGPFGTYDALSFEMRLGYWGLVIAVSIVIALFFRIFWRLIFKGDPAWVEDVLVIGSLAITFGPAVSLLNARLWPGEEGLVSWLVVSVVTFVIGMITVAIRKILYGQAQPVATPPRDRLLDRIGAPEGARLRRVSSDNHHIRVITQDGQEHRILMRLRDAVAEIDVEPGFCVHRSHWIAAAEITTVERAQGRELVRLPCGAGVPIGPKYRPQLVEAGIISA